MGPMDDMGAAAARPKPVAPVRPGADPGFQKGRTPTQLEQVVGIILGSPEFQRR
jgi:hypothetical protein